jgi:hypothetical protein
MPMITSPMWRNDDGGYGPVADAQSEPEATAMVALAFDDRVARDWLVDAQQADGSIGIRVGSVVRDLTALAALALTGSQQEAALDHVVTVAGANGADPAVETAGWPWTLGAHGWTEPTAWGLMAIRARPSAADRRADALAFFAERECDGGGWNYGAPETLGIPLGPYVQTSALALLALGSDAPELTARGVAYLERAWPSEAGGVLSLATTLVALRETGSQGIFAAARALEQVGNEALGDTIATCWLAFARGYAAGPWSSG